MRCGDPLRLGFVPLVDSVALVAAHELGFFEREGLKVALSREVSWATVRDKMAVGALDGAHMLAPLALASTLGVGSDPIPMVAPLALNLNGPAITLSSRLGPALRRGPGADGLAGVMARRRAEGASVLTFAVVYPYSVHAYLLRGWMAQAGIEPDRDLRLMVASPLRMAELLEDGIIEGFCAGEPWNSAAEASGAGRIVAWASQLRDRTPDKVFGVTEAWAAARPDDLSKLVRALQAAAAWLAAPGRVADAARLLSQPAYLGADTALIEPGLADLVAHHGAANAPRSADGAWLASEMIRWGQAPPDTDAAALASRVYRPDLYEAALAA